MMLMLTTDVSPAILVLDSWKLMMFTPHLSAMGRTLLMTYAPCQHHTSYIISKQASKYNSTHPAAVQSVQAHQSAVQYTAYTCWQIHMRASPSSGVFFLSLPSKASGSLSSSTNGASQTSSATAAIQTVIISQAERIIEVKQRCTH